MRTIRYILPIIPSAFLMQAAFAHELPLNVEPENGQDHEQLVKDKRACEDEVTKTVEEPHPLGEDFDRTPGGGSSSLDTGLSTGVETPAGGVTGRVGANPGPGTPPRQENTGLSEAQHLQRHNSYEIAMTACLEEKGYSVR